MKFIFEIRKNIYRVDTYHFFIVFSASPLPGPGAVFRDGACPGTGALNRLCPGAAAALSFEFDGKVSAGRPVAYPDDHAVPRFWNRGALSAAGSCRLVSALTGESK